MIVRGVGLWDPVLQFTRKERNFMTLYNQEFLDSLNSIRQLEDIFRQIAEIERSEHPSEGTAVTNQNDDEKRSQIINLRLQRIKVYQRQLNKCKKVLSRETQELLSLL